MQKHNLFLQCDAYEPFSFPPLASFRFIYSFIALLCYTNASCFFHPHRYLRSSRHCYLVRFIFTTFYCGNILSQTGSHRKKYLHSFLRNFGVFFSYFRFPFTSICALNCWLKYFYTLFFVKINEFTLWTLHHYLIYIYSNKYKVKTSGKSMNESILLKSFQTKEMKILSIWLFFPFFRLFYLTHFDSVLYSILNSLFNQIHWHWWHNVELLRFLD